MVPIALTLPRALAVDASDLLRSERPLNRLFSLRPCNCDRDDLTSTYAQLAVVNTFTANQIMEDNLTVERINLETDPTVHYIDDNATCTIIRGDTSTLAIC